MHYLILLPLLCSQIEPGAGEGNASQKSRLDEIVLRNRNFAVSHLADNDPMTASAALDALATLDCDTYLPRLREKLSAPISDPSLDVALRHLIKRANRDDLKRAQEIVAGAAKLGELERKEDPYLVNAASIEFLALEVLLASGDPKAAEFATDYLEKTIERNPGPGITQMELALDLVGRYAVKSAAAKIQTESINAELHDAALSAMAKNGQQPALDTLRKRMNSWEKNDTIISDSQLVDRLEMTDEQLRAICKKGDRTERILAAGQLARKRHMEELHTLAQDAIARQDDSTVLIETMIARFGDESFVEGLDTRESKAQTTAAKLQISQCLFEIARRVKSSEQAR